MSTFVLIHGAGDVGWYWHLVEAELRDRGHDVVAPDLPCDDDSATLWDYAATVLKVIGDRTELVVVAQSFGAFTAPLVCERRAADVLVLVAGLIPSPGEAPKDWWANTGYDREEHEPYDDEISLFYQDVPPELAAEALRRGRNQSDTPTREPWPLDAWPDVPTRFLLCREDRLLPAKFLHRVVRERLGFQTRLTPGTASHSAARGSSRIALRHSWIREGQRLLPTCQARGSKQESTSSIHEEELVELERSKECGGGAKCFQSSDLPKGGR